MSRHELNNTEKKALDDAMKALDVQIVSLINNGERIEIESLKKSIKEKYIIEEKAGASDNIVKQIEKVAGIMNYSYEDAVNECLVHLYDQFIREEEEEEEEALRKEYWKSLGLNNMYILDAGNNIGVDYEKIVMSSKVDDMYLNFGMHAKLFPMTKYTYSTIQENVDFLLWNRIFIFGDGNEDEFKVDYIENESGIIDTLVMKHAD